MRYVLKQKFLSWGDDYHVRDESGREAFFIDGKVFTIRNTLVLQNPKGAELATIQKKILSWGPTYEVYRAGELSAVVKKHLFTLFRCKFTVDVPGPDDLEAQGNFFDYEYTFRRGAHQVAQVSRRWFSWADTYGIDVSEGEDAVLIVASAIVIDQICHEEGKH